MKGSIHSPQRLWEEDYLLITCGACEDCCLFGALVGVVHYISVKRSSLSG